MTGPNPYFDMFNNREEQSLHDGLIQESIEIYGEGMYYLPRRAANFDHIYTEDDQDYFDTTYLSTFYIKNVDGFEGQGNFMSKFGLEIRDQITLVVSNTIFTEDVGVAENFPRPREGDLIYFPLNDKVFEIVFVDKFTMYFPLGATPTYTITCQLFEYKGERFLTGIPSVDKIQKQLSENLYDGALLTEDGLALLTENGDVMMVEEYSETAIDPFDQGGDIQTVADDILDFTETDPYSEGSF
jgi:hypothetical protein